MLTSPVLVDTEAMRVGGVNDCTAMAASMVQRLAKAIWLAEIRCELGATQGCIIGTGRRLVNTRTPFRLELAVG